MFSSLHAMPSFTGAAAAACAPWANIAVLPVATAYLLPIAVVEESPDG